MDRTLIQDMPSPLHSAVQDGNIQEIERLLNNEMDIDIQDLYKNTPLFYAIIDGKEEIASFLISHGANVNAQNFVKYTPLHLASEQGNFTLVKMLIDSGANINKKDEKWGATPLLSSAFWGHPKIVRYFCKNNAQINGVSAVFGYTALHLATIPGNVTIVKDLLDYGAELDKQADNGATPLLMAVGNNAENTARLLVKCGAGIDIQDNKGETPLYCATTSGNASIVQLLLSKNADINHRTKGQDTVIHAAAMEGKELILEALLQKSSQEINAMRNDRNTPLHIGVRKGNKKICKILLKYGALPSVDIKNSKQETPSDIAFKLGKADVSNLFGKKRRRSSIVIPLDFDNKVTINKAMAILKAQFPFVSGLQTICDVNEHHFTPRLSTFMQIMKEEGRYTLASTIGMQNGHIEYYDPVGSENALSNTVKQSMAYTMSNFNESSKLHIHRPKIEHSFDETKSGILCVAIAICILRTGYCPKKELLADVRHVEESITIGIKNKKFQIWFSSLLQPKFRPINPLIRPSTGLASEKIIVDLHCICHMPLDKKMVDCNDCGRYIHRSCVQRFDIREETPTPSDSEGTAKVYCPDCIGGDLVRDLFPIVRFPGNRKTYDAFVSYSYSDFSFVKNQLITHLEDPRDPRVNFQLMIQHRNMMPGEDIPDAILDAISESRKCIAVISKNYIMGQWTRFEWTHMVWHKFASMILVLIDPYEEFDNCDLPPSLKNYLDNKLCLEWKEDFNTEKRIQFWEQLRRFLEPPLNYKQPLNVCGKTIRLGPL